MSQETLYLHFPQWQGSSHRDGPSLIRGSELIAEALNYLPFERIDVSRREASETLSNIRAKADLLNHAKYVRQIIEKTHPKRIVTLGGDCGVDLLPITYLHKRYGSDLAVIWIDAHADLNTPASSSSQAFHGMVLRACLGEGDKDLLFYAYTPLSALQVFLAGTRKFDPPELAFYEQMNMKLFRSHELEKRPETLSDYLDILTASKLHIHLDLDVLDESVFQAVGYPSSEGLSFTGLTDLLNSLYASFDIVGFSMTEFMPKKQSDAKNFLSFFTHNPLL